MPPLRGHPRRPAARTSPAASSARTRSVVEAGGARNNASGHAGKSGRMPANALDTQNTAPSRAAIDDLELEPARCVRDDEGVGRRQSADVVSRAAEEAPPTALGPLPRAWRSGVTMPEVAEPSHKPVAPGRALQSIHLVGSEWDENVRAHWYLLQENRGAASDWMISVRSRVHQCRQWTTAAPPRQPRRTLVLNKPAGCIEPTKGFEPHPRLTKSMARLPGRPFGAVFELQRPRQRPSRRLRSA